jgi:hypothetical protein
MSGDRETEISGPAQEDVLNQPDTIMFPQKG